MVICLVRRSDILHMEALINRLGCESEWIVVSDLVSTDRELVRIHEIFDLYNIQFTMMKSRDVVKYLKQSENPTVLRQDHWKGWGVLNNVHKYSSTIYTDYVTLPNVTTTNSHTNGVRNSEYIKHCTNVYKSFKPEGIERIPESSINSDKKIVLMVFHFDSGSGINCSYLSNNIDKVIDWIEKKKEDYTIVISLHPEIYKHNKSYVESFSKIDDIIISDENVYSLAKKSDYIVSDGISILYESSLINKGVSYLCNGKRLFNEDNTILYENTLEYDDISKLDNLQVNYSRKVKDYVKKNSDNLSQHWERRYRA